ncbi:glutamate receptor 1 [Biomphalaria glabrata]|nr:glutamate receptor 1 [Biomphalaria glabrata]
MLVLVSTETRLKSQPISPRRWRFYGLRDEDANINQNMETILYNHLHNCGWNHVMLVLDENAGSQHRYVTASLNRLYSLNHVIVYMNTTANNELGELMLEQRIEKMYTSFQMANVVVMSQAPEIFMQVLNNVFQRQQRGPAALMVHRMQLMLFVDSESLDTFSKGIKSILFDNVVIISSSVTELVSEVYTLMWGKDRAHDMVRITDHFKSVSVPRLCSIFPNVNYRMNRLTLKLLTKEWLPLAYKVMNKEKGTIEYEGFLTNVVRLLSEALNFTYNFSPVPGEDEKMSWKDFARLISQSKFDVGVSVYPSMSMVYFNHTVTFPLLCSNFTGVYVNTDTSTDVLDLTVAFFRSEVYYCFMCSLVYTLVILKICARERPSNCDDNISSIEITDLLLDAANQSLVKTEQRVDFECQVSATDLSSGALMKGSQGLISNSEQKVSDTLKKVSNFKVIRTKFSELTINEAYKSDGDQTGLMHKMIKERQSTKSSHVYIYDDVINLLFELMGSYLNQANLPNPSNVSARVMVWSWCVMALVLNAIFSGNILAYLVDNNRGLPLSTLEDLLARRDYKIVIEKDSSLNDALQHSIEGTPLRHIYTRVLQFREENPDFTETTEEIVDHLKKGRIVAILSSPTQEYISQKYIRELATLKNVIFETCSGFILPKDSELESWISEKLQMMSDYGLLLKVKMTPNNDSVSTSAGDREYEKIHFKSYMFTSILYGFYALAVSLIILIIEVCCIRFGLVKF